LQQFLAARQDFGQSLEQARPSYGNPTSKTQVPTSRAAQRQYEIAIMWFSMQPIDSMAKHKRAVPCMRDGAGIEGSALVGVGKEAVSTNQCKKWLRGKKVLQTQQQRGQSQNAQPPHCEGWLKPDVGLSEGNGRQMNEKTMRDDRWQWGSTEPAMASPAVEASCQPSCMKLVQRELGHLGYCSTCQFEDENGGDYWQIVTPNYLSLPN
jgi:hypothetical protein